MALINATWKVTHAGVILLDWTDFTEGEPRVERAFVNDRVAVLRGDSITNLGRGNVSHTASFNRVVYFENDNEARTFEREHTVALPSAPADCLIQRLNTGESDTLVDAVITSYRTRVENNFFFADYTLLGGEWLTTGFVPPIPDESAPWRLVTIEGVPGVSPGGVELQVRNSDGGWEVVWSYVASS
jgi:hypothetical protein